MLIRRIRWEKGYPVLQLPRSITAQWHLATVHHVIIDPQPDGTLRIRPLPDEELLHYPAPPKPE